VGDAWCRRLLSELLLVTLLLLLKLYLPGALQLSAMVEVIPAAAAAAAKSCTGIEAVDVDVEAVAGCCL